MVLEISNFKLHLSLKKSIRKFLASPLCEVRFDTSFEQVIRACADSPRHGQKGSWIVPEMIEAYCAVHRAGVAHSVETWINGKLVGGLYCVALGKSVFGESMFSNESDASKIALAALVAFCREHDIVQIDCQQNTQHLASLGAKPVKRQQFINQMQTSLEETPPVWCFEASNWNHFFQAG
jgi:leucyl/phenylalanyl-tRNA--protein transferase